jgi:serine/threonine-protein kinase
VIEIGSVVNGKYRIVRTIGDGGMGSVYEAQHAMLGTRVAIKVLHPELVRRTGLVERFLREAHVVAQIRSLHVVQVIDVDRTPDGHAYIVMELLEGEPLSGVLDRHRKLPVALACEYASQILAALEAAHALGVIHRDLKPENVIVTFAGGKPVLKLIDFGIAKAMRADPRQKNLTVVGVVMGTAEYMAPEQARSAGSVDVRADIYAAGVMLYEMIAGTRPVRSDSGEDARVIALKVERGEVIPLVQAAPDAPREIAGLVHHAMAARPEMRFATATEMRIALEGASARRTDAGVRGPQPSSQPSGASGVAPGSARVAPRVVTQDVPVARSASPAPSGVPENEPHVDTVRAPPLATALVAPAYSGAITPAVAIADARGAAGSRGLARTAALVGLAVLFCASVVGILVGTGALRSNSATLETPAASTSNQGPLASPAPPLGSAPPSLGAAVPTLSPARPGPSVVRPAAPGRPAAIGLEDAGAAVSGFPAGLPSNLPSFPEAPPVPTGFPTAWPSGFPMALPSGFPTALPSGFPMVLPSGFPTALPSSFPTSLPSGFPGVLPAWPGPSAPAATSAHPASAPPPGY